MLWVACPSRPVPIADGKRCMFPPITATFGGPVAGSLYGHVRRPRRPGPNMVFVVPVAGSATGTAGTTGHADDSALRGCHESRGTRYSERHSAQIDAGRIRSSMMLIEPSDDPVAAARGIHDSDRPGGDRRNGTVSPGTKNVE